MTRNRKKSRKAGEPRMVMTMLLFPDVPSYFVVSGGTRRMIVRVYLAEGQSAFAAQREAVITFTGQRKP